MHACTGATPSNYLCYFNALLHSLQQPCRSCMMDDACGAAQPHHITSRHALQAPKLPQFRSAYEPTASHACRWPHAERGLAHLLDCCGLATSPGPLP